MDGKAYGYYVHEHRYVPDSCSALLMACGNLLGNEIISGMSNITLMMILGIVVQALGMLLFLRAIWNISLYRLLREKKACISDSAISILSCPSIFGFGMAGVLPFTNIVPDPAFICNPGSLGKLPAPMRITSGITFAGIGLVAAIALLILPKPPNPSTKEESIIFILHIFAIFVPDVKDRSYPA